MAFPNFYDSNSKFASLLYDHFYAGDIIAKLKSNKTVNLEIGVEHCCKTSNLKLDVLSKLKLEKYKIELIKKFSSSNVLTVECKIEDLILANSGHQFTMTNDFSVGHRQAIMTNYKKTDKYHVGMDFKFISDKPIIITHGLFGYQNYFIGGKLSLDTHKKHIGGPSFDACVGYSVPDFSFQGLMLQNKKYEASVYSRINENMEIGVQVDWHRHVKEDKQLSDVNVSFAAHVALDRKNNTFMKLKTTNGRIFALTYGFDLMQGVQLALSGKYSSSDVQFGLGTTMEMD